MFAKNSMVTPKPSRPNDSKWWEIFYDDAAMAVLADQDPNQVRHQSDRIIRSTGLIPGQLAMDQCCGLGQHACELAARGIRVIGIDQSRLYIDQARGHAADANASPEFVVADALAYRHHEPVDAVYNWHSSFGYLDEDSLNQQMLRSANGSLRDGGVMLLEFPNMDHLMSNFRATMHSEHPGGVSLERQSKLSEDGRTLRQTWTYRWGGHEERRHKSSLRIYHPDQLIKMFCESGFRDVRVSSHDGDALTADNARLIVTGRKRGDD